jgi:hypothetical protein
MTSAPEYNKDLIRAHYQATANHFDPAAIDDQVGDGHRQLNPEVTEYSHM